MQFLTDGRRQRLTAVDETVFPFSVVLPAAKAALCAIIGEVRGCKIAYWQTLPQLSGIRFLLESGQAVEFKGQDLRIFSTIVSVNRLTDILQGMSHGHAFRSRQFIDSLFHADVIIGLWAEHRELYQIVVTLHCPLISDGDGVDRRRIVVVHLIVIDSQILRVFRALQLTLLDLTDYAPRAIGDQSFEIGQSVVLAARTGEMGKALPLLVKDGCHLLQVGDGMGTAVADHICHRLLHHSVLGKRGEK